MKHVDEYRDPDRVRRLAAEIARRVTRPCTLMEVCGGQTHAILRFGLDQLLPAEVELVHGPGCPVCVTPAASIDRAIGIATTGEATLCTFGDMLRVPGSQEDLYAARGRGADVRVVYSPLDAVRVAADNREREVVFFAVGFETTAPANALALLQARAAGLTNFSLLTAQVLVPPAMAALLEDPSCRVQAFLAAGHVCAVMGTRAYEALARRYRVPIVVTGFEPVDVLQGVLQAVVQLESGRAQVENAYRRVVHADGNPAATDMVERVFLAVDQQWRGMGCFHDSGLALRPEFADFDAARRFGAAAHADRAEASTGCLAGEVLRGTLRPPACPAFGVDCTPMNPLGAPMVSNEGACAAYYRYGLQRGGKGGTRPPGPVAAAGVLADGRGEP